MSNGMTQFKELLGKKAWHLFMVWTVKWGKGTYLKKLDLKTLPFSSRNRGQHSCNNQGSPLSSFKHFAVWYLFNLRYGFFSFASFYLPEYLKQISISARKSWSSWGRSRRRAWRNWNFLDWGRRLRLIKRRFYQQLRPWDWDKQQLGHFICRRGPARDHNSGQLWWRWMVSLWWIENLTRAQPEAFKNHWVSQW